MSLCTVRRWLVYSIVELVHLPLLLPTPSAIADWTVSLELEFFSKDRSAGFGPKVRRTSSAMGGKSSSSGAIPATESVSLRDWRARPPSSRRGSAVGGWLLYDRAVRLTLLDENWEEGLKNWMASKVTVAIVKDFRSRQESTMWKCRNCE